jgi:predicted nucleic acid-binding protein
MNANTAFAWSDKSSQPNVVERFWRDVDELKARYSALWWETATETPVLGEIVGRRRQAENARETARLIDFLAAQVEDYPETEPERLAWRDATRETVRRFGEERFGWPRGYRDLLFADEFVEVTREFARQARASMPPSLSKTSARRSATCGS